MSYILKALKKLEQEKAARRVSPPDIQSAILAPDRTSNGTFRTFLMPGVILLLLSGSGVAYLLMHRETPSPATSTGNSVQPASPLDNRNGQLPAASDPVLLPREVTKTAAEGSSTSNNPAAPTIPEIKTETHPSSQISRTTPASGSRQSGQEPAASPPTGMKVNGIALQDDPDECVAVVNGILARRGATVQGMRVEEILSDRVRFSGNGETFDVKLSK